MKTFEAAEAIKFAEKLKVEFTTAERDLEKKALFKIIMKKWLPAGDTLLEMISIHLPSPVTAQKYRVEMLYEGPSDDVFAKGIAECDPNVSCKFRSIRQYFSRLSWYRGYTCFTHKL